MKSIKRLLVVFLIAAMLFSGCVMRRIGNCVINMLPEQETPVPVSDATEPPATEKPQPTVAPDPTSAPVYTTPEEAEQAFWTLDDELFRWYVTQDITSLDQYCAHPEDFGIDESTVPVTLGELSKEENDRWIEDCRRWKERLGEIDRNALSEHLAFSYDTYERFFDLEIESADWFYCTELLDLYVGAHMNLPLVFGLYQFKDKTDVENYMTLLADVPRFMGELLAFEEERANRGLFMTENALDQILNDVKSIADSAETSYLHDTFREAMEKVDFLSDDEKNAFIEQNDELVRTSWVDGYRLLYDGLTKLRPKCRAAVGAYEQGGDAYDYFCWMVKSETAGNRTVSEQIALSERCVQSLFATFLAAAANCGDELYEPHSITTGTLAGDEAYLKTLMPKIVPAMPEVEVEYREIPEELQEGFSPAAYLTPSVDDYVHNIILTNPASGTDLSTLAHEGFPGHMFQFTYQYALGTIPKFQMAIETNGYAEAWSTNSELNVAYRNDRFDSDLATALLLGGDDTSDGFIMQQLVMICSLKVNGQGASQEDIRKYLDGWNMGSAAAGIYNVCIDMPIYYFKYAGGFAEQYDLTQRCMKTAKCDSVTFYTEYLSWGPGYFDLLNERMDNWASAQ